MTTDELLKSASKRPWKSIIPASNNEILIVRQLDFGKMLIAKIPRSFHKKELAIQESNSRLICRAVNSFQAARSALKSAEIVLTAGFLKDDRDPPLMLTRKQVAELLDSISKAIELAEGKDNE